MPPPSSPNGSNSSAARSRSPACPTALAGRTLVHLSDIHLGPRVSDSYLLDTFSRISALNPDIVVYTGDFIDREDGILDHAARLFPSLPKGRLASFGTLGNHDYGKNWANTELAADLANHLRRHGIRILRNQRAEVHGLAIIGLDDEWAHQFNPALAFHGFPPGTPAIALSHNPDTADMPGWGSFTGWILSGHTHGGQCKPPFLPPPLLPVKNRRYVAGAYDLGNGSSLYVNRGIGHLLKARFNARPEVTVFTLNHL